MNSHSYHRCTACGRATQRPDTAQPIKCRMTPRCPGEHVRRGRTTNDLTDSTEQLGLEQHATTQGDHT